MDSGIQTLSWWALTRRVLFSPRAFFAQLDEPLSYRSSVVYLAKTASVASLLNTLVLTLVFYLLVASFASILTAFIAILGTLLTPAIAVAANIPPEKVPAEIESFARNGGVQVTMMTVRLGVFLLIGFFSSIVLSTCLQAGLAHGIARLLGCSGSFRVTVAVYSFGSAAWMLSVIPVVNLLAPVYGAVLNIMGLRHVHRLSGLRATLAIAIATTAPLIGVLLLGSSSN